MASMRLQLFLSPEHRPPNARHSRRRPVLTIRCSDAAKASPAPCPSWRYGMQEPAKPNRRRAASNPRQAFLPQTQIARLFPNRPCRAFASPCQIHTAEEIIATADKGLVVVDQPSSAAASLPSSTHKVAYLSASWAFSCLHGRSARFWARLLRSCSSASAWLLHARKHCPTLHLPGPPTIVGVLYIPPPWSIR